MGMDVLADMNEKCNVRNASVMTHFLWLRIWSSITKSQKADLHVIYRSQIHFRHKFSLLDSTMKKVNKLIKYGGIPPNTPQIGNFKNKRYHESAMATFLNVYGVLSNWKEPKILI